MVFVLEKKGNYDGALGPASRLDRQHVKRSANQAADDCAEAARRL
uniref:Uncharacterized protein n=1 Tax=Arundo donax TaxID=35708 RepID=A0A0A9FUV1_ARUDO